MENKKTLPNGNYGGRQGWFYDKDDSDEDDLMSLRIEKNGCGIIACSDLLLYLQKSEGMDLTDVKTNKNTILFKEYNEFVRYYTDNYLEPFDIDEFTDAVASNPIFVLNGYASVLVKILGTEMKNKYASETGSLGCIPTSVASSLNEYAQDKGYLLNMKYYLASDFSKSELERKICDSLEQNMPSILLLGLDTKIPYRYKGHETTSGTTNTHYVVITGISFDDITGKTTLEVSTWSYLAYIVLEDFLGNPGTLGGIVLNE